MGLGSIEIDGIRYKFDIERKDTKSIKYKVYPDLKIKIIVPFKVSGEEINERIKKRKWWIKKSLDYYLANKAPKTSSYHSGSSIYYLGRQYRLKIVESNVKSCKLVGKFLVINTKSNDEKQIEAIINKWYKDHALVVYGRIMNSCLKKMMKYEILPPIIKVRKMAKRWGSCSYQRNKITLNLKLIKHSSYCIEYVIMHELCHLKYPHHNKQFYNFLTMLMPDWIIRKHKLDNSIHY